MKKIILSVAVFALSMAATEVKAQWSVNGNTVVSGQFMGSVNTQDVLFKANNKEQMRINQSTGNVTISLGAINTVSFAKLNVNPALTQNNVPDNIPGLSVDKQLNASYARRIFFVPHLTGWGYNQLSQDHDLGIFWTDASNGAAGSGNRNLSAGLVIAPFASSSDGIRITANGSVGIGTRLVNNPNNYKLAVNGTIGAKAVKVEVSSNTWADYVFNKQYKLKTLSELEAFIKKNNHLPNIPSTAEVEKDGIDMATMMAKLLEKVEELSLYIIEQNKQIEVLKQQVAVTK
jgi:hypothetical protein